MDHTRCTTRSCRALCTGGLNGVTGILHLDVDEDGTHRYELKYEL